MAPSPPLSSAPAPGLSWAKRVRRVALVLVAALWGTTTVWHTVKPLPPGVHVEGQASRLETGDIAFLHDLTYRDPQGEEGVRQEIFDEILAIVGEAERLLVLDLFLFNDHAGNEGRILRPLSDELLRALERRKRERPDLRVLFITDPINHVYGGDPSPLLAELEEAGVEVVLTRLERLRDSNLLYSGLWRVFFQWFGNSPRGGWLPHLFDRGGPPLTLRTYLRLFNFKANHRKVVVADAQGERLVALVTSANPHDASSAHSNVAFKVYGRPAHQVLRSELAVARFSGWEGELPVPAPPPARREGAMEARYLTEGAIREQLLHALAALGEGDRVDCAMFYLSERGVVDALVDAARRGARIRLVLDPNRDAFGLEKDGVPNRPVAHELVREGEGRIEVRWYETHGEQFHTKMTVVRRDGEVSVSLGSANLTRRNLRDLNLEANLHVTAEEGSSLDLALEEYYETLWSNRGERLYTVAFERYRDPSTLRYWRYRVMEATGLSTF